MNKNR